MNNLRVSMMIPERHHETLMIDGRFSFKHNKGSVHRTVQKALFWLLEKLGCQAYDHIESVTTRTLDFDNLFTALADARMNISHSYPGITPHYLLIGPEWYQHLVGAGTEMWPMSAYVNPAYTTFDYNTGTKMAVGLEVVVIPWMAGDPLILPRIEDIHRIM